MPNLSLTREYNRIFTIMRDEALESVIWDNASTRTATLFRMKQMGAIIEVGGMPHLRFNILKQLPTAQAYTDLDIITPVRADPWTSIVYEWKQIEVPIQVSGLDVIKTADGDESDLLRGFIEVAEIAMRDTIGGSSIGIFSNIGETSLTGISGFRNILTTTPTTGTCGQLSRVTNTNWRQQTGNISNSFTNNGLNTFRTLYRQCARFDEVVDTIVCSGSMMDNYERALTNSISLNEPRESDKEILDGGFDNIRYKGAIMFADDGVDTDASYFLNLAKYTRLIVRRGRNAEISDFIKSKDYDDLVSHILWAGELVTTNLARQGIAYNGNTWS